MLTTFFSTSRPIQYLMVLIMVTIGILLSLWWHVNLMWWDWISLLILPACLALFEFIVSKNELIPSSSYALWAASLLALLFIFFNVQLDKLIALFLILLALRRLLSLKTSQSSIKKIFDATLWISIATVFYHWSALFYLIVFVAVFLYVRNDYRHWIAPFIAILCVWILLFTYDYVRNKQVLFDLWNTYNLEFLWQQSSFNGLESILLLLLFTAIMGLLIYLSRIIDIQQSVKPRFTIITFMGICAFLIALLDFTSFLNGGFLLLVPPLGVFIAGLAHLVSSKIITELLLWFPLVLLVTSFLLY